MRIAVDAMGGDHAPDEIVKGILAAEKEFSDVEYILYGDGELIKPLLGETYNTDKIKIVHTDEKIESDDEPVRAVRSKRNASMVLAARAVKNGEADALFSAGNTGALLASGLLVIGRIKGIDRPGLMPILPVIGQEDKQVVFMDVGANADSKAENVHQFGILGSYYSKFVLGVDSPRVALLNNGSEDGKGSELSKQSFELLKADESLNFIGNLESRELLTGQADVIVTDGFTGNAVLKTIEGTAAGIMTLLKNGIMNGGIKSKLGALMIKGALSEVKDTMDYSKYGGAVLFGLRAPVIKTHGSADQTAVFYTIKQIRTILSSGVIPDLVDFFEEKNTTNNE